jgi:isochorismate hydrolase
MTVPIAKNWINYIFLVVPSLFARASLALRFNAFDDARVARAIEATGRKKLIFAGISLEVCAAFPAITAVGRGLDAYVVVDASGTFSETKRQVGLLRMLQAGVIVSDYATLMVEILKDNARPEAGEVYGAMDMGWAKLVGQISQAYGK